jgi:two-component system chemotaxis response regulator CheB
MTTRSVEAIVIGGSTGSLQALSVLLPLLPAACKVPIVIVLHLPPTSPSQLVEVLASRTVLPVKEVEDKDPVVAGFIYVAPPSYHLLVERGRTFALSADELLHFSRPAIDVLFESAAEAYGPGLLGVVLSGANEDGARGLSAIERLGGLAVVQSPETAAAPTMPAAAIALTRARYILPLDPLASLLARVARDGSAEASP